jgi:hypothetical protein
MHVATGANLVAHDRDALLAPDTEPVIVADDGLRYVAAQFSALRFNALVGGFAKFQRLEFQ